MPVMARLTDITSYADAQAEFSPAKLWELFDGDREHLNIAHECIDRHAGRANPAVIVVRADGSSETLSFQDIAEEFVAVRPLAGGRGRGGRAIASRSCSSRRAPSTRPCSAP